MMDFSNMTPAQIKDLLQQARLELHERTKGDDLLGEVTRVIEHAKSRGFTKQQVSAALTSVVNKTYA